VWSTLAVIFTPPIVAIVVFDVPKALVVLSVTEDEVK